MNEYIERQQRVYYMTELSAAFYLLKLGKSQWPDEETSYTVISIISISQECCYSFSYQLVIPSAT